MDGFTYLNKLEAAYRAKGLGEQWDAMKSVAHGITEEQKSAIIARFPGVPEELLQMLSVIDGTYYREYVPGNDLLFYMFGSDVEDGGYPYYLHSFADIMEQKRASEQVPLIDWHHENPDDEIIFYDKKLLSEPENMNWMCFSHCMNNGGTSALYIDFTPSPEGRVGQIVRELDDEDGLLVIADSFAEFLDLQEKNGFAFVSEVD